MPYKCGAKMINMKKSVALGTFDGVHKGHAAVIKTASEDGFFSTVIAFRTPPKFSGGAFLLTNEEEKTAELKNCGAERIEYLDFENVKDIEAEDFINGIIEKYSPDRICCGYNYRFGKGAVGDTELLKALCKKNNIELKITDEIKENGETVCSTAVRRFLSEGETEKANLFLGRKYSFSAKVSHGDKRGRELGFPTVNQYYPEDKAKLKFGVYKAEAAVDGAIYPAVANIGVRPTYPSDKVIAESFIIGYSGNAYGKEIKMSLLSFIREEKKFSSFEELKAAIDKDVEYVKKHP